MLALTAVLLLAQAPITKDLVTLAEKSGWKKTGRYDEVIRLCGDFALAHPGRARCVTFGGSPEGRPLVAIIASDDGVLSPEDARAKSRPVVVMQGGIHAGEIDGKDAGFLALRELLSTQKKKRKKGEVETPLSKVTLVFVPVFNVDGHERFGPNHRPNQNGPEEMGWRVTSQNLNLNRDYAKAETPEMRDMLRLLGEWDPIVYVDLHVTDGADFRHEISYIVEPLSFMGSEGLRAAAASLRVAAEKRLTEGKHLPLVTEFYPAFEKDDDPSSGVGLYVAPPRFSSAYWSLRNRIAVLVETHAWKDYPTRVRATHDAILATLDAAARDGERWLAAAKKADQEAVAGKRVPLVYDMTGKSRVIEMLGYAYQRSDSPVSGQQRITYDRSKPEVWKIPFKDEVTPVVVADAPGGGYVIPPAHAQWVREKLETHGIQWTVLRQTRTAVEVQSFRATKTTFGAQPYEGRQTLRADGEWKADRRDLPAGSLFVPIAQPKARLAMHLLEPRAPDSFLAWGFFNAHFERKEYMEAYVAETIAVDMLKDPAVAKEFEAYLLDPEIAKDPGKRLDFFYRRHPSFDERWNLYPVLKLASPP